MKQRLIEIKNVILPHKKINLFVFSTIILGIISGSIFSILINTNDKKEVITSVQAFMNNISNINYFEVFKNSLFINYIFIILMFILGLSLIGIIINVFIVYIRNFILGFSISAFFITYGFKGILEALIYVFPQYLIIILITYLLGIYSILFSIKLVSKIFDSKNNNLKKELKRYILISLFSLVLGLLAACFEAFLLPTLTKLVIKVFI